MWNRRRDRWSRARSLSGAALLLFAAVVPAVAQATPAAAPPPAAAEAPLEPGDALKLTFWREPVLSGTYPVDEAGGVALPYLGLRTVTATPTAELRRRLLQEYEGILANQGVHVEVLRRVRVLGAVRSPGLYRVDPTMSLADALALAGGVTPDGRLDAVRLVRDGREQRLDLERAVPAAEMLRSGDQIVVPERSWMARNSAPLIGASISALGFIVAQALFH
jgi:polysaccharide export outer membrane protein